MKCAVSFSSGEAEVRAGTGKERYKCGLLREWFLLTKEQLVRISAVEELT